MFHQVTEVLEVWESFAKFQKFCPILEVSPVSEFCTGGETSFTNFRSFAKNLVLVLPKILMLSNLKSWTFLFTFY
jgi:hypothetical protein